MILHMQRQYNTWLHKCDIFHVISTINYVNINTTDKNLTVNHFLEARQLVQPLLFIKQQLFVTLCCFGHY